MSDHATYKNNDAMQKSTVPFPKVLLKKKLWFIVVILMVLVTIYVGLRLRQVTTTMCL